MPAGRCSMRKIREILRLRWGLGLTQRQVATSVRTSASTVFDTCARAKAAGLSWPLPEELDDEALEGRHEGAFDDIFDEDKAVFFVEQEAVSESHAVATYRYSIPSGTTRLFIRRSFETTAPCCSTTK